MLLIGATPVWLLAQGTVRVAAAATTAATGAGADSAAVAATILQLGQALDDALARKDWAAVEQYRAPDAIIIYPNGNISTGARDLQNHRAGGYVFDSVRSDSVRVRVLGPTAIVTARVTVRGYVHKQDVSGAYRVQNVWVKRAGKWQMIASQGTSIPRPPTSNPADARAAIDAAKARGVAAAAAHDRDAPCGAAGTRGTVVTDGQA